MKILLPDAMTPESLRYLEQEADVVYDPTLSARPDALMRFLPDAEAIIVRKGLQVRGAVLDALTSCRVVGRLGVGLDNIDVRACEARGMTVVPATGQNARAVAEYVVAMSMTLLRGAYGGSQAVVDGQWPFAAMGRGREIQGKTLGIVGYGSIGRVTAQLAGLLGMRVIALDRGNLGAEDVPGFPLPELLAQSDVVSLHVPLTETTRGLLDAAMIRQMKPGAMLINVARGGVVDETALADALRDGYLGGAAIDVYAQEPLAGGSVFQGVPNLILTPHIAGVTAESEQRVCAFVARRVVELLRLARA